MASSILVMLLKRSRVGLMGRSLEGTSAEADNVVVVKRGTLEKSKGKFDPSKNDTKTVQLLW